MVIRRGDYLTHEEVGERLKRFLQPSLMKVCVGRTRSRIEAAKKYGIDLTSASRICD